VSYLKIPVTAADHIQGPDEAPVTMVEYGDYEYPYCGLAFQSSNWRRSGTARSSGSFSATSR
jgi:protein-disulfide isomerase